MTSVLLLMTLQGSLGAFDTVYYHEYRARLVAGGARTRTELSLHAARDVVYALLFGTLPFVAWSGTWAWVLAGLIAGEIGLTLTDFAVESWSRGPEGVAPGERVTHGVMAIVYGAFLALLAPRMVEWAGRGTGFVPHDEALHRGLQLLLLVFAVGVFLSGLRDAYAALGGRKGGYPWA